MKTFYHNLTYTELIVQVSLRFGFGSWFPDLGFSTFSEPVPCFPANSTEVAHATSTSGATTLSLLTPVICTHTHKGR